MTKKRIDFTGIETYQFPSEGRHPAKIVKAEETVTNSGDDAIKVTFEVIAGADKGARISNLFSLTEKALWKLKTMLQAFGMKCDGEIILDLDKLVKKVCFIDVVEDEYDGKKRAKIDAFARYTAPASDNDDDEDDEELEEEEQEEEKPAKKRAGRPRKQKEPEKEVLELDDEDEEEPEPVDDEEDEEEEPEEKPVKKSKKQAAPVDDDDDYDDGEDW